jgi:hypothetical protein
VKGVARRALHDLQQVGLRVQRDHVAKRSGHPGFLVKRATAIEGTGPSATC